MAETAETSEWWVSDGHTVKLISDPCDMCESCGAAVDCCCDGCPECDCGEWITIIEEYDTFKPTSGNFTLPNLDNFSGD